MRRHWAGCRTSPQQSSAPDAKRRRRPCQPAAAGPRGSKRHLVGCVAGTRGVRQSPKSIHPRLQLAFVELWSPVADNQPLALPHEELECAGTESYATPYKPVIHQMNTRRLLVWLQRLFEANACLLEAQACVTRSFRTVMVFYYMCGGTITQIATSLSESELLLRAPYWNPQTRVPRLDHSPQRRPPALARP
jgi:hypothetical protein